MKTKTLSLICGLIFAVSSAVFAQNDEYDEWIGESSDTQSKPAASKSYDGSTDSEFADDEDYAQAYARYKSETTTKAEINRQRTEGFSRAIMLGIRAQGGTNTFFGSNSDGWGPGWQVGGGLLVKMPLGIKFMYVVPELTFNFRQYLYQNSTEYGEDNASIDIMMFEIPIIVRYTLEDYNMYFGLGLNIGLTLMSSSEYNQGLEIGSDKKYDNTIKTSGVEVGGAFDIGYMFSRYLHFNFRVVQCFTSLLNQTLVAQKEFMDSTLLTFYVTAGISIYF